MWAAPKVEPPLKAKPMRGFFLRKKSKIDMLPHENIITCPLY
jgi:hypothetical protein